MFVPAGYVKLEGGTVNRENYPRLVALADAYNLWTSDTANNPGLFGEGDGSTTMVLPNWAGRMAQFAATAGSKVNAGVPNITGATVTTVMGQSGNTLQQPCREYVGCIEPNYNASSVSYVNSPASITGDQPIGVKINASLSSSIYGNSTTVQPPAINVFAIMRY